MNETLPFDMSELNAPPLPFDKPDLSDIEWQVDMDETPTELLLDERWTIRDDGAADWTIRRIGAIRQDCDRKIAVCKSRIANLQKLIERYEQDKTERTNWFWLRLQEWFRLQPNKRVTKTSERYDLPSGRLVLKRRQPEIQRDEAVLLDWVRKNLPEAVKVTVKPDWAAVKEAAAVVNGQYVIATEDGEVVPVEGVTLVEREPEFVVEVGA